MRIENFTPDCFTVFDAEGLDPINVVIQDFGGSGRIIIECYGKAWATYFGAVGNSTIRAFLAGCSVAYVANRMDPKGGKYLRKITTAVLTAIAA